MANIMKCKYKRFFYEISVFTLAFRVNIRLCIYDNRSLRKRVVSIWHNTKYKNFQKRKL